MERFKEVQVHFFKSIHEVADELDKRSDFAKQEKFREILSNATKEIEKLGE